MGMGIEGAIACLSDKQKCKYCLYESGNCRHDAIDIAVRSMKAWGKIEDEVYKIKHNLNVKNTDYQTGYLCALSVVQGLMAEKLKEVEE